MSRQEDRALTRMTGSLTILESHDTVLSPLEKKPSPVIDKGHKAETVSKFSTKVSGFDCGIVPPYRDIFPELAVTASSKSQNFQSFNLFCTSWHRIETQKLSVRRKGISFLLECLLPHHHSPSSVIFRDPK